MIRLITASAISACIGTLFAQAQDRWTLAQSPHFEVFSQNSDQSAAKALLRFEQMRTFFIQDGLHIVAFDDRNKPPLRVIGFRSEKEYAEYRIRPFAGAYYASDGARDNIIMASLQPAQDSVAAHEYFHYVLHSSGLKLPACLQEGLAEVFSTLRVTAKGYSLGGDVPVRSQALTVGRKWSSLEDLFTATEDSVNANGRKEAEHFYAESWALADLLISSPKYAPRFHALISEFNTGSHPAPAFQKVYGLSLDQVVKDLASWTGEVHDPQLRMVQPPSQSPLPEVVELSAAHTHYLLAELSLVSGHVAQAASRYQELSLEQPTNPDVPVALGLIALRQGNRAEALKHWSRAIQLNVKDADICYRYALLADEAGADPREIKAGLARALLLSPSLDDARYRLALIEYHAAEYRPAIDDLKRMSVPTDPHRRYAYWIALTSCLLELNENDDAHKAALEAAKAAQNDHDRSTAKQLAYVASTEMHVQLSTDAKGQSQMVATRAPRGTNDWNPFIQPSDVIEHSNGQLSQVLCAQGKLSGFVLQTPKGSVTLDVADPSHVLMRNGPSEFYCGPVRIPSVAADYAVVQSAGVTKNILRGMTFQP